MRMLPHPASTRFPIVAQPATPPVVHRPPSVRAREDATSAVLPGDGLDPSPRVLRIRTLGDFQVLLPDACGGGVPLWPNDQSCRVLKRLLAAPGYHLTTDALMEYLWPDCGVEAGRALLRGVLSKLRRALESDHPAYNRSSYLASDHQSVRLLVQRQGEEGPGIWLDGDAFERLAEVALAERACGEDGLALAHASLALYQGPFLPMDCYDDWSRPARERYLGCGPRWSGAAPSKRCGCAASMRLCCCWAAAPTTRRRTTRRSASR